jgi:hypothetical protein
MSAADRLARQGAPAAGRRGRAAPIPLTPEQTLRSPTYYTMHPLAAAIVRDKCQRGVAPRSDCAAVTAARR